MKKRSSMQCNESPRSKAWYAWLAAAAFYLYEYFVRVAPSVMEADLRQTFHANATVLGFATGLYYIVYGPMQIIVGPLFDRFGARRLLLLAAAAITMGCFCAACPLGNIVPFAIGRLLMGLGSSFAFIGTVYVATLWFSPTRLAFLSGLTTALGMSGAILGQAPIARMVQWVNWRNTWLTAGLLGMLFLLTMHMFLPKESARKRSNSLPFFLGGLWIILRNPQTWIIGFVACFLFMPLVVFADFWGIHYVEMVTNVTKPQAALINGMLYAGWLLGSPFLGALSDRLRHRRWFFIISCGGGMVLLLAILIPSHFSPITLATLLFLLGIASSPQVICFIANVELNSPHLKATAMAIINTIVMLFGGFAQPLCGLIMDMQRWIFPNSGNVYTPQHYRIALMVLPITMAIGLFLAFFIRESFGYEKENNGDA
ncbi:MAG: MFS transporter [Puniceicoccales bacterium]|jgi:MFS family permease|nr:MFS transporter [Puniceicoccales bacterium]